MQLTEQNVQDVIINASMQKAVFLYFYMDAPECAPVTQALTSAINDNNEYISLVTADVKEPVSQAVAMQLGLQGVPALVIFVQGQPQNMLQGQEIVTRLQELIKQYMPSESDLLLREALSAEAAGDDAKALEKSAQVYNSDNTNLSAKHIYARLLIKGRNLTRAKEVLANPGREESESSEYQDLISALNLAEKAQDSPELHQLEAEFKAHPSDELALKYSAALVNVGKKAEALELLFEILRQDLSKTEIKKTFLDILSTMSGDPLQGQYRRRLYTLMY